MNKEVWQSLLSLESQEYVKNIYKKIFDNTLNTRRAKEINSSAKQAREYFRNANNASFSVRPLLVFYGVSSLSRALTLFMKQRGGEEGLTAGHGLTTESWSNELSGDLNLTLKKIGDLKVKTTAGLFTDFINTTENIMSFHISSSGVDWITTYPIPPQDQTITFGQILSRLPDLAQDFKQLKDKALYSTVNEFKLSEDVGFKCKVRQKELEPFKKWFSDNGYKMSEVSGWTTITSDIDNFNSHKPQFIHSYVQKTFGSIPGLYVSKPFDNNVRYSQLGMTFLASYFLGMLVRYYPTHWTQLINGGVGDNYWPVINRLQGYVEESFPELVIELILEMSKIER
ncbi:YaaC family protein [Psychroserpens ponticola]|uniref:YaaC family protein n=1 Tax=Psychroserpens ponticola TaxID=2932268 RepID=A0ABY7S2V5_9FLAO|nr:YaaC family protein [Psychroserpens ponticola]WCO03622.1 YaaC family protein [Psychroserpens ponticola]